MFQAVLFDLDGTLLDIELDSFLHAYFAALGPVIATIAGPSTSEQEALDAVISGTHAMTRPHAGRTNRSVFNERFFELTGASLEGAEARSLIDRFYAHDFPGLQGPHVARPGGIEAVRAARDAGMATVLATNPIFPRDAVLERMRWAELDETSFDLITSYETSSATKPAAEYYLQIAEKLGVAPGMCLMVGDDPVLDMSAADIGMRTFFVGDATVTGTDWQGGLEDVRTLLLSMAPKG